ncbi:MULTISPECIES: DUF4232 domain-containing protein [Amycolatopsis]|uniref:DUF4232 domain-containing protein n=2 Tax=Amycolatopsis TaxID=1813 RepID=A0A1I4BLY5_9PSEU|nr:DUF4232 domain-containing protein [Amycolatopsis sacchari]SFK69788.1 Protein of unknown function [Amycolatopsis sacchari]
MKRVMIGISAAALTLAAGGTAAAASTAPASTPRCATTDLAVSLGAPVDNGSGQFDVPLTYRNISDHTCGLFGVPGVDLVGPEDPMGPVYHLPRVDNGVEYNEVTPGTTASATITVLPPAQGDTSWTPSTLVTTPPGQTEPLTVGWPSGLPVLRQDAATHPGSYVNGILADPA